MLDETRARASGKEEATGMPEAVGNRAFAEEEIRLSRAPAERRSESPVVKTELSPASFASDGPELPDARERSSSDG